jgi:hypothetical protein
MNKQIKHLFVAIRLLLLANAIIFAQPAHTGKGEVIAVRLIELKAGVDTAEFEKFAYEQFNPGHEGTVPGLKEYIAKSDRGTHEGSYALFMVFDSQIVRDTMIPNRSLVEWADKILVDKGLWTLWNKLNDYVVEGSLGNYNDYVVLK